MLGAEERDELHSRRMRELIDGAAAERILPGVIGDQADMLTAQRRKLFSFEDVDAKLHTARTTRRTLGSSLGRTRCVGR